MHWKSQSGTTLPQNTSALKFTLDSEFAFADEPLPLNLVCEEKRTLDHSFETRDVEGMN